MSKFFQIVFLTGLSFTQQQCGVGEDRIPFDQQNILTTKYGKDVLNYFYEIVFYQDYVGPKDALCKWKNDVRISMEGQLWPNDSLYISNAICQLNALEIPVKLYIVSDTASANVRIHFGSFDYLKEKLHIQNPPKFRGCGFLSFNSSAITSAKIGIANNSSAYSRINTALDTSTIRQSIILQEITQVLGPTGDSWKDHESVFFEGINRSVSLSEIDKQLIGLLYENTVPGDYSRTEFETDFRDILPFKYPKRKIVKHAKDNRIPVKHFDLMNESLLSIPLSKYSGSIFVFLTGNVDPQDTEFCKAAIAAFNKVSDHLHLESAQNDIWYQHPSIKIQFVDSAVETTIYARRSMMPGQMMFPRRIQSTITIATGQLQSAGLQHAKNKLVFKSLYKILGLDNITGEVADIDSLGNITFKPDYQEILALLYNPVIPNGFTKKEMEEVIAELKKSN